MLAVYPCLMYFHPEYFAANDTDLLEARMWLPFTIPLFATILAIPILTIAIVIRYFTFRSRTTPTI